MKKNLLFVLACLAVSAGAQTKTTNDLHKKYDDAFVLFFYSNTLKMLNQKEDKEFDELIKDIEKMKFLMFERAKKNFTKTDYNNLVKGYQSEQYENIMTARSKDRNFDVYLKEVDNRVKGTVMLVNDSTNLYVLDIVGRIAPDQIQKFFSTINESSEMAIKIKDFMGKGNQEKKLEKKGIKID